MPWSEKCMLGTAELGKWGGGMEPVLSLDRKLIFKERRSGISNFLWKPKIALAFPCSRKEVGSLEPTRPQGLSPRGLVGCPLGEGEGTRIMGVCFRVGPLGGGRAYRLLGHQSTATGRLREGETKGVGNEMVSKGKQK